MSRKRTNPPKRSFLARLRQLAIDVFLPADIYYDPKMPGYVKWIHYTTGALFFTALVALCFEIDTIENTFRGTQLFWRAGFAGILIAAALASGLKMTVPNLFAEFNTGNAFKPVSFLKSIAGNTVLLALFSGLFLLTPAVASFVNKQFAEGDEICRNYPVAQKTEGRRALWLYLKTEEGREERFSVTMDIFNAAKEGQALRVCTRKGAFGYEFATVIGPANN